MTNWRAVNCSRSSCDPGLFVCFFNDEENALKSSQFARGVFVLNKERQQEDQLIARLTEWANIDVAQQPSLAAQVAHIDAQLQQRAQLHRSLVVVGYDSPLIAALVIDTEANRFSIQFWVFVDMLFVTTMIG
jgi:hypothetical protein